MVTKKRASGKINEEHVCIDSFIQHLREIGSGQRIFYCDNSESRLDPPDFCVNISGVIYAVEVTSITDYDYEALCKKFFDDIRSEFATSNIIKGTYSFFVTKHPKIPKKGTSGWKTLISTIATNIQDMSNAPYGTERYIIKDKNGRVGIKKLSDQGAKIALSWVVGANFGGLIQEELSQLIKKAIEKKRKQLEKKRKQFENKSVLAQYKNVILLFYDAYGYSNIEYIQKALSNVQDYDWLHSIFVALACSDVLNKLYPNSPGRKGMFLYSKNEHWQ